MSTIVVCIYIQHILPVNLRNIHTEMADVHEFQDIEFEVASEGSNSWSWLIPAIVQDTRTQADDRDKGRFEEEQPVGGKGEGEV